MGTAFAQTADGGAAPAVAYLPPLLMLLGVFYFALLRPEQKRRREHDQMVGNLKRNDQIVLSSGIHARVQTTGDKVLTVEIAPKVLVQVDREAVQSVSKGPAAEPREKEREKS